MIQYFVKRHFLTNLVFVGVLALGVALWFKIGKEEMPDFEGNWLRINAFYAGAASEEIEQLVTRPIEQELKSIPGLKTITSSSSMGTASIRVEMDRNYGKLSEIIQEVKDAALNAPIPIEVKDDLRFRHFKTSEKTFLDIAIIKPEQEFLDYESRHELQTLAKEITNQLTSLDEIGSISASGTLQEEIQIVLDHNRLRNLSVPINQVTSTISKANTLAPSGTLADRNQTRVSVVSKYQEPEQIAELVIRSNVSGNLLKLKEIASVTRGFADRNNILKVNGREAVILNLRKTSSTDILTAQKQAIAKIAEIQSSFTNKGIEIITLDDESFDVRNRISLISMNGLAGFFLILGALFLFLDFKTGIWVASGIPFTLCFTIIISYLLGYTVNNMTLASIIIVLGIVVDDAVIVAENITRLREMGRTTLEAAVEGTKQIVRPVIAAAVTTCIAFLPFYFFSGHMASFVIYIPVIVTIMLGSSLIESLAILPSHLTVKAGAASPLEKKWFKKFEIFYQQKIRLALNKRYLIIGLFSLLLLVTSYVYVTKMKFVLFPREESREISLKIVLDDSSTQVETAKKIREIEDIILNDGKKEVVGVRSTIARSRRGGEVKDNEAFTQIELLPSTQRDRSTKELSTTWKNLFSKLEGYKEIKFVQNRFGSDSGSPINIEIRESNDGIRNDLAEKLRLELVSMPSLTAVEVERPIIKKTLEVVPNHEDSSMSGITLDTISNSVRAYLNGFTAYSFIFDEEKIDVVVKLNDDAKRSTDDIKNLLIENNQSYLIPLHKLTQFRSIDKPNGIERVDHKRVTSVFADIKPESATTPLDVAVNLETNVFPKLIKMYPTSSLRFKGEVANTRESKSDFKFSIAAVLLMIFAVLLILFESFLSTLIIMLIVPFGLQGVILAFWAHQMSQYGFFALIGAIGMIGVVINDSIILVSRLDEVRKSTTEKMNLNQLSEITTSRLRAIILTTLTTVAGVLPTAYGVLGYDSMLAEMMLAMGWGLFFGTTITLILTPAIYSVFHGIKN